MTGVVLFIVRVFGIPIYETLRPKPGDLRANSTSCIQKRRRTRPAPPTSGPHYSQLADWGIHDEPISNELQVQNLEDGGVMVQYNCPTGRESLVA